MITLLIIFVTILIIVVAITYKMNYLDVRFEDKASIIRTYLRKVFIILLVIDFILAYTKVLETYYLSRANHMSEEEADALSAQLQSRWTSDHISNTFVEQLPDQRAAQITITSRDSLSVFRTHLTYQELVILNKQTQECITKISSSNSK